MVSQNNATGQCGSAGETNQNMEMSPGTSDVPPIHAKVRLNSSDVPPIQSTKG